MDLEILTDRYKSSNISTRMILVIFLALLVPGWIWFEDADILQQHLEQTVITRGVSREKFDKSRKQLNQLPALLDKLAQVETQLEKAKRYLPKNIQMDHILHTLGNLEREEDVKLVQFVPGLELQPDSSVQYRELPVQIAIEGQFSTIMSFLNRIVHMTKIIHLREVSMAKRPKKGKNPGGIIASAKLIIFRSG